VRWIDVGDGGPASGHEARLALRRSRTESSLRPSSMSKNAKIGVHLLLALSESSASLAARDVPTWQRYTAIQLASVEAMERRAMHTLFTHFQQKRHVRPQRFRFIVTNGVAAGSEGCRAKRIPVHPSFLLHAIIDIYCAAFDTIHSIGRIGYAHSQEILGSERRLTKI
jgi:hypothetical protein